MHLSDFSTSEQPVQPIHVASTHYSLGSEASTIRSAAVQWGYY